jgi:dipeptidyl aminopeptidase/acylaminoacyl peptidase
MYVGTVELESGELAEVFAGPVRLGTMIQANVVTDASASVWAAVHEAPGLPPEVAILDSADPGAGWREVTSLNAHLKELPVPDVEEITWQGEGGLEIEGLLVRPAGVKGPLPMIVNIHGGPTGAWEWSFSPGAWGTAQIFSEAGYATLLPNPRGSAGRGREFTEANRGDVGGGDFRDILAGVDACVERGIAIDDQIGAWGGSYGGFMSAWIVGNSDRFKAIVPVSCHTNWLSFHNTANVPGFDRQFVDADPYEADGRYFHLSPVVHAPKAVTPTLFLHGALDKICPLSQAEEMYRALIEAGVETELAIYPREGHRIVGEHQHAVDQVNRMLAWFDRHIRGIEREI